MMQLLVQDLTDLQKMKYDTFRPKESPLRTADVIDEIVAINKIQADQSDNRF